MYSVFISYRRDGGEAVAQLVNDRLRTLGFQVFYDIESLHSGAFDKAIYSHIDACDCFVLILSPLALERCTNDEDWVRKEILYAYGQGKRIIPLFTRGFLFPALPIELAWLPYQNGVQLDSMTYLDSAIEKLITFFDTENIPETIQTTQQTQNIDETIKRHISESEGTQHKAESFFLRKMSEKVLRSYFDRSLAASGMHTDDVDFYQCSDSYFSLRQESSSIGDPLIIPINNGEVFFAVDAATDVQIFAIYEYKFDSKTKQRKAKVSIEGLTRKNAGNGILVSLEEHTKYHNEYVYFGGTTVLSFSEQMQQRSAFSAKTNEWLNDKIREKGKFSLVSILNDTGFGENRSFALLLNHADHQLIQVFKAYYSKRRKNGVLKEYIVIDIDNRIDLTYCAPKIRNNEVLLQHENNIKTYMADIEATTVLYDPIERRIILRYISENGSPEVKINVDHPLISIPFSAVLSGNYQERMMTSYELGKCYFDGTCNFPRNVFKAMQFFEEDGNADSLYEAGYFLYRNPEFADKEMAFEYLLKAAFGGKQEALPPVTRMLKDKIGHIADLNEYEKLCEISRSTIEGKWGATKKLAIKQTASLFSMLADVYYDNKDYSNAIKYDSLAVSLFDQMPPLSSRTWDDRDLQRASHIYLLGVDYFRSKQYDMAEERLLEARQLLHGEYHFCLEWNCITVGILHCKIMRWLALTYREMRQYSKQYLFRQSVVSRSKKLMQTKAEDVFKGESIDIAQKLIEEHRHAIERWLVKDLLDFGWNAYVVEKYDVAETCVQEVIGLMNDIEIEQGHLCSAYYLLGRSCYYLGREAESEEYIRKAKELDNSKS